MKLLADMHLHSTFSPDAIHSIDDMCKAAIDKGLEHICFTDHLDLNRVAPNFGFFDYNGYTTAIDKAKEKYSDQINILKGIEFSEPHLYPFEYETILKKDFDLIMVGVHSYEDCFYGDPRLQERYSLDEIYEKYYENVLKTVKYGGFNILAHLDFPKRYIKGTYSDLSILEEIFKELIKNDAALEINTAPIRRGFSEYNPEDRMLEKYFAQGGTKITIGSDAHSLVNVAAGFEDIPSFLERYPKCSVGFYEQRQFKELL